MLQKFVFLNDSIITIRNNYKNKFAKIKYDSKKEKDENEKLRLEKAENLLSLQRAKYMRIVFVIVFIFLVFGCCQQPPPNFKIFLRNLPYVDYNFSVVVVHIFLFLVGSERYCSKLPVVDVPIQLSCMYQW